VSEVCYRSKRSYTLSQSTHFHDAVKFLSSCYNHYSNSAYNSADSEKYWAYEL